jgi:hypothetical protein
MPRQATHAAVAGAAVVGVVAAYLLGRGRREPAAGVPWLSALEDARAAGRAHAVGLEPAGAEAKRTAREPRNARSAWRRPVGDDGEWFAWVQPLQGQTGVYLIRDRRSGEVLYIGECHRPSQGLLKTMRRHFWQWSGPTAGPTFNPKFVEVSYELTGAGEEATARQFELIQQLQPRDNVQDGRSLPRLEDVPF